MNHRFRRHTLLCAIAALSLLSLLGTGAASATPTGGAQFVPPPPPPKKAKLLKSGRVLAPRGAPKRVKRVIAAANQIVNKPYRWGGGHGAFSSRLAAGYDCSGAVSHALRGGRFIKSPMASGSLMSWGRRGTGRWITVYAHGGHAYVVVAGLRFDTSMRDRNAPGPSTGPRWSKTLRRSSAFVARHPKRY
jgi:hypothetical protein